MHSFLIEYRYIKTTSFCFTVQSQSQPLSYLECNQIFTLEGNNEVNQLGELKKKVSEKFDIPNDQEILIQKYDAEWNCFIDIDNNDAISDLDKLKIVTMPGSSLTHHAKKETTQQKHIAITV